MKYTAVIVSCALTVSSCASNSLTVKVSEADMQSFLADKPEPAKEHFSRVLVEGERNRTLNFMRTSLIAMDLNDLDTAKRGFDQAIQRIEAHHVDSETAKAARSTFKEEGIKDFKGESYERAMAYYYRGILDLIDADYENARASFRAAQIQDVAEEGGNSTDFASVEWLAGWASFCRAKEMGPDSDFNSYADEHFYYASQENKYLRAPKSDQGVLAIVEVGGAPEKVAQEESVEISFQRGEKHQPPNLHAGRQARRMMEVEDIFQQASTRGRRGADQINENKAEFKQNAENIADASGGVASASLDVAHSLLNHQNAYGATAEMMQATEFALLAGVLGMGVSLVSDVTANAAKPDADLRYWDNLPDKIYLGTARSGHDPEHLSFSLGSDEKKPFRVMKTNEDTCSVAWVKTKSPLAIPSVHKNAL